MMANSTNGNGNGNGRHLHPVKNGGPKQQPEVVNKLKDRSGAREGLISSSVPQNPKKMTAEECNTLLKEIHQMEYSSQILDTQILELSTHAEVANATYIANPSLENEAAKAELEERLDSAREVRERVGDRIAQCQEWLSKADPKIMDPNHQNPVKKHALRLGNGALSHFNDFSNAPLRSLVKKFIFNKYTWLIGLGASGTLSGTQLYSDPAQRTTSQFFQNVLSNITDAASAAGGWSINNATELLYGLGAAIGLTVLQRPLVRQKLQRGAYAAGIISLPSVIPETIDNLKAGIEPISATFNLSAVSNTLLLATGGFAFLSMFFPKQKEQKEGEEPKEWYQSIAAGAVGIAKGIKNVALGIAAIPSAIISVPSKIASAGTWVANKVRRNPSSEATPTNTEVDAVDMPVEESD